ncbi:hypothetical protein WNY37_12000 [Henriciella sp. AS95]
MNIWIVIGIMAFVVLDMIVLAWLFKRQNRNAQPGLRTLEDEHRDDS